MNELLSGKLFGIVLSLSTFYIGTIIHKKFKSPLLHPLLISIVLIVGFLYLFQIPIEYYNYGGDVIFMFLTPATAVIACSVYQQLELLKKYYLPVILGCIVGAITSSCSILLLCRLFHLDKQLTASLLPKSVTAPIAMEISSQLGGFPSITVAAVLVTGILGAIFAPLFIKILKIRNKIAAGVAIGSCSHALGTTTALKLGEIEGAMSGVSIGISGLVMVILLLIL